MTHRLKLSDKYYGAVLSGQKPFELRLNDRRYAVGDMLILQEVDSDGQYTGRIIQARVSYVLQDERYLQPGYVALGLVEVQEIKRVAMTHTVHVSGIYYDDIRDGKMPFLLRHIDPGFNVGDRLLIAEINSHGRPTGALLEAQVTYVLQDKQYLQHCIVALGLANVREIRERR